MRIINNIKPSTIEDIKYLLEQQLLLHSQLLELSYEKRQVIINGDIDRLNEIIQQETEGFSYINAQEKAHNELIMEISKQTNLPANDINISAIIKSCDAQTASSLADLQKRLISTLENQSQINKVNQDLLKTQLDYGQTILNVLVGPEDPLNNLYTTDGSQHDEKRESAGFFDKQA